MIRVDACPRLARGVRLSADRVRGGFNLLAPEHVLRLNASAVAIVQLCDGAHSIAEMANLLAAGHQADRQQVERDIMMLIDQLTRRHMVET